MAETPQDTWREALLFVLAREGGYVNDPKDPGGATNLGITQKTWSAFKGKRLWDNPPDDVKYITRAMAGQVYAVNYWAAAKCNALAWPMCLLVFDSSVNCGVHQALDWLKDTKDAEGYLSLRHDFYLHLCEKRPVLKKYLRGWLARLDALAAYL